jgi:hypothetical protein
MSWVFEQHELQIVICPLCDGKEVATDQDIENYTKSGKAGNERLGDYNRDTCPICEGEGRIRKITYFAPLKYNY